MKSAELLKLPLGVTAIPYDMMSGQINVFLSKRNKQNFGVLIRELGKGHAINRLDNHNCPTYTCGSYLIYTRSQRCCLSFPADSACFVKHQLI